jgi:hypothetical protein
MPWSASQRVGQAGAQTLKSVRGSVRLVWQGLVEIGHNSLAVLGLACIALVLFFSSDSALRAQIERQAYEWLNLRHGTADSNGEVNLLAELAEPDAANRASAKALQALPKDQAAVASWLARRYRVAPEAVARLVHEAWVLGKKASIEPSLILAIMAVESSFNPFAQSPVGAQGLMQVMTSVHNDKYDAFGGKFAAFDPVTNLRVGVQVLAECVARAGGSVELGLKYYVGAANLPDDGGYAERVFFEQAQLKLVASGQAVPLNVAFVKPPAAAGAVQATAVAAASGAVPAVPISKAAAMPAGAPHLAGGVGATAPSTLSPAAHAAPGTVMAPAVGAALAANLSAPAATTATPPTPTHSVAAIASPSGGGTAAALPTAGSGTAAPAMAPAAPKPAQAFPDGKEPKDTKASNDSTTAPPGNPTKVAAAAEGLR